MASGRSAQIVTVKWRSRQCVAEHRCAVFRLVKKLIRCLAKSIFWRLGFEKNTQFFHHMSVAKHNNIFYETEGKWHKRDFGKDVSHMDSNCHEPSWQFRVYGPSVSLNSKEKTQTLQRKSTYFISLRRRSMSCATPSVQFIIATLHAPPQW